MNILLVNFNTTKSPQYLYKPDGAEGANYQRQVIIPFINDYVWDINRPVRLREWSKAKARCEK